MTHARSFSCFLYIHSELYYVQKHLYMPLRLHVSSYNAKTKPWFSIFHDKRWNNRMQRSFAWFKVIKIFVESSAKVGSAIYFDLPENAAFLASTIKCI